MPAAGREGSDDSAKHQDGAAPDGGEPAPGADSMIGLCVKWEEGAGYGFLHTTDQPDAFLHKSGLDDIAADRLNVGDEVRYVLVDGGEHGDVAKVTEFIRGDVKVPDDYRPQRREAEVSSFDKHTGWLTSWNEDRRFGMLEMRDGTTVLLTEKELRGNPIQCGDKVLFEKIKGRKGNPKAVNITVLPQGRSGKKGGGGKSKGKGHGKGWKGWKGWWKGSPQRRRRRSSSRSSLCDSAGPPRRRRREVEVEEELKKVKKEPGAEATRDGAIDVDAINAAADADAALAVMTAFRKRAHTAAKKGSDM
eukprot:gene19359-biopygen35238